jgi:regulation of enolase protein 1 (concanavalin A-like superfamily)
MDEQIELSGVPAPMQWLLTPEDWRLSDGGLTITAGPRTDLFADPETRTKTVTAPALTAAVHGDFWLSARVRPELAATYDAGVLVLYAHPRAWAKLCLERSPQGRATVVTVVTREVSDDCNSFTVDDDHVWLRITRFGGTVAFHASGDGKFWQLVRYFTHDEAPHMKIGFLAQSPTGEGCSVTFDDIRCSPGRPGELRNGE